MKKFLSGLLSAALAASLLAPSAAAAGTGFTDVPAGSSLAGEVEKAVDCGLMNGYDAGTFGYGDSMTRAQFVTVLGRMMGWSDGGAHVAMWMIPEAMEVPSDLSETYLFAIEQAAQRDVVDIDEPFRPSDPVTRGEMAELLVRALGLKGAAEQVRQLWASRDSAFTAAIPFTDVTGEEAPYIQIAYTIGMTNGTSATTFSPGSTATRAQAAAMLVRIYEKITAPTGPVHGFYAISSYSQLDLAGDMDAVSAGWSRMTWDGETAVLRTTSADGNEYAIPSGYEEVTDYLSGRDVPLHLSVFMEGQELKDLLASPDGRAQAVEQIVHEVTVDYQTIGENPYSGVTIDFEGLRQGQKADFTAFLTALDAELEDLGKELYVCVSPVLDGGSVLRRLRLRRHRPPGRQGDPDGLRLRRPGHERFRGQPLSRDRRNGPHRPGVSGPCGPDGAGGPGQGAAGLLRPGHRLADRRGGGPALRHAGVSVGGDSSQTAGPAGHGDRLVGRLSAALRRLHH